MALEVTEEQKIIWNALKRRQKKIEKKGSNKGIRSIGEYVENIKKKMEVKNNEIQKEKQRVYRG